MKISPVGADLFRVDRDVWGS